MSDDENPSELMLSRRRALKLLGVTGAGLAAALGSPGLAYANEFSAPTAPVAGTRAPVVRTRQGRLQGFTEDGVSRFLGIPFGRPPVGDLRWRPTKAPESWSGVRDATAFGNAAYQSRVPDVTYRTEAMSEDCLYLNVWTTDPSRRAKQPVVVWFHGGGYTSGAASEMFTDGANLARLGLTVVAPNYRLGVFGYLNDERMGTNFAVLDQVAALEWVHENIEALGGDPSRVLIFGYSAGAGVVRSLLQAPRAEGLFHRAVIQSVSNEPPTSTPVWTPERPRRVTEALWAKLGTTDPSALRAVPAATVLSTAATIPGTPPPAGGFRTPLDLVWMPVPDGEIVADDAFPAWSRRLPVMFSSCQNESRFFLDVNAEYPDSMVSIMSDHLAGPVADTARRVLADGGGTNLEKLDRLFNTTVLWEPELASLRRFSGEGRTVYSYRFERVSEGRRLNNRLALHGTDVFYIFGNLLDEYYEGAPYDATDHRISREMQHAFAEFAATGVPRRVDGARWPSFTSSRGLQAHVGDAVSFSPYETDPLIDALYGLR